MVAGKEPVGSEFGEILRECRGGLLTAALVSGAINLLMLTGSVYMLVVYDRVLVSGSIPTLVGVTLLGAVMYLFMALFDVLRARILARVGMAVEETLAVRVYAALVRLPDRLKGKSDSLSALRDLDQLRSFVGSTGLPALFDLPWIPVYLAICFLFHWMIGAAVVVGALVMIAITLATDVTARRPSAAVYRRMAVRNVIAETTAANAEAIRAMGMTRGMARRFRDADRAVIDDSLVLMDRSSGYGALSRVFRLMVQSGVLGLCAYLVIIQEASGGVMIASSILTARALAPVEQAIANWKTFTAAREGWTRLGALLAAVPPETPRLPLPPPSRVLDVQDLGFTPEGRDAAVLKGVGFSLSAGDGLGVIGPSGSGKSTLVRAIAGALRPTRGEVLLDGSPLPQYDPEELGRHVGYLPQEVQLISGTVAENISRFDPDATAEKVVAAARLAGAHEMIARLPDGYNTLVGQGTHSLSGGQAQRVALARALYGEPFLVILDEPSSNLDAEGELALISALRTVRERGSIVILVAHRTTVLGAVDTLLLVEQGAVQAFGPKQEVLQFIRARQTPGQERRPAAPAAFANFAGAAAS